MESFKVGSVILGKYRISHVLGKGGMGLVLAARHLELDEMVALKVLLPSLRDNPEISARFAREARTAVRVKNEHVARILDVGSAEGSPFIVMEYLSGKDLAALLKERGPLDVEEAVDLLLQACEGIAEAHRLGVVHRDLKPGNLFVTISPEEPPVVKVLDFGISKMASLEVLSVTESTAVLGSPVYMSPEQLTSSRDVDARSDVWSLGVIFYEMITGSLPFNGESFPALCAAVYGAKYTEPSEARPALPTELDAVVAGVLTLDREARLPSVEAFAARLAPFGSEDGRASYQRIARIASRPRPPSEPPARDDAPEQAADPAAASPTLLLPTDPSLTRSQAQPEPPSRSLTTIVAAVAAIAAIVTAGLWMSRSTPAPAAIVTDEARPQAPNASVVASPGLSAPSAPSPAPSAALHEDPIVVANSAPARPAGAPPASAMPLASSTRTRGLGHASAEAGADASHARSPDDLFQTQE